ncbi:sensor histidine kinase [Pacificimonas flava]|uniref:histidine kinase n=1 Tax=Pacificimonas flava TaxID=1234595 RepID=M2U603_9SPHN|nr:ATP-binding protein [Pacificimonas flava]EMD83452.1 Sensor histidine kinase [Pacificimonas flava]MBB5278988.1 nitrogen fixation/metabolism regulation signal transduction histidine kinase [Pacificimonas flava]
MGFDVRFTVTLCAWLAATLLSMQAAIWTFGSEDLLAARIVASALLVAAVVGTWRHITRTNRTVASFLESLHYGDLSARVDRRGGAGFDRLGQAMDAALRRSQDIRETAERQLRFLEGVVDDVPVAILTIDQGGIHLANKAARQLLVDHDGIRAGDFAVYGATFAQWLAAPRAADRAVLVLRFRDGLQRALVRCARLERLGQPVHIVSIEPLQGTLESVEVAAQTDLVRVLTHEILNSLTPVMSLSRSAADMLREASPDLPAARDAVKTLARRAESLRSFIDRYRAVARAPSPRVRQFAAGPFIAEIAGIFKAEWPCCHLETIMESDQDFEADPDLLGQALINLMRNAGQASAQDDAPRVRLALRYRHDRRWLEIEDNGPGIPEALRSDVFLPFYTTKADGSGIGLNLARQIVVASGWTISIEDSPLGGALIRIGI